ncbi:Ger(x)C family spore germination protein [Paenibacillus sp. NPDC056579]|uniref:Ger(x)C family spore germination protein n=1 Tax=Paenibacillus sp. NPDC056579 TaxID=3345871 RepID=UPI003687BA7D
MKRIVFLIVILVIVIGITGCWNRQELNEIAITVAMGLDKRGNQYQVSVQIVNPSEVSAKKGSASKGTPVATYSETGKTVSEALRKMVNKAPRVLYFSHLRLLVIGEGLAKEGIGEVLDYLSREYSFRTDFYLVISKGVPAERILEVYTLPQEVIPANKIFRSLQNSSKLWGAATEITLDGVISDATKDGKQPVLSGISITGAKESESIETKSNVEHVKPIGSLTFSGMAAFKKDKMLGWLNQQESRAYYYIEDKVDNTVETVSCPDGGNITIEILRSRSDIKGILTGGKPEIDVQLQVEGNLDEVQCDLNLTTEENLQRLEKITESHIQANLEKTINSVKRQYKSDIFGFGEAIHRTLPRDWVDLKNNWNDHFVELPVHVSVDVKIRRIGTLTDSFVRRLKE